MDTRRRAKVPKGERVKVPSGAKGIAELIPPGPQKKNVEAARARLRGSVQRFDRPTDPVIGLKEWDANR